MTPQDTYATLSEVRGQLVFRRILFATPETVWKFLVEDEKRGEWLCRGLVEPRAGGRIEFKFDPEDFGDERLEGTSPTAYTADFEGKVVTYEPLRCLAFTWPGDKDADDTKVTMTLTPTDGGTELELVHERISSRGDMVGSAAGWHTHLERLEYHLTGQRAPNFFERHDGLEKDYQDRLAKLRQSETTS